MYYWIIGLLDNWIIGLLDNWIIGLLEHELKYCQKYFISHYNYNYNYNYNHNYFSTIPNDVTCNIIIKNGISLLRTSKDPSIKYNKMEIDSELLFKIKMHI